MSEGGTSSTKPGSDIYTILLAVACMFLLIATVFMSVRSHQIFDRWHPFGGI
ncbi:MAG: hypothetical protein HOP29_03025 [Phycisphaerales bacterium]|nr:hypothetical protein [Phycisphaerales bacterium]